MKIGYRIREIIILIELRVFFFKEIKLGVLEFTKREKSKLGFRKQNHIWGFRSAFGILRQVFSIAKWVPFEGACMIVFVLFMVAFTSIWLLSLWSP